MNDITSFPREYVYLNEYVEKINLPNKNFGDGENDDFFVLLKDGRLYSFTAFTTKNIEEIMERDNLKSFISPGLIIVKTVDIDSIMEGIDECLKQSTHKGGRLDHFGILQT
jgi:hypothetical protein